MNFYYFGDGYATGHLWPEWPQIIEALFPEHNHCHHSGIGCGNEFIATAVTETYQRDPDGFYFVQWAWHNRFDKLLQDHSWDTVIDSDSEYRSNKVQSYGKHWWLSSQSKQSPIAQYHSIYCQSQQALTRQFVWVYLTGKLLKNQAVFCSTNDLEFSTEQKQSLCDLNWAWPSPWRGMISYSAQPRFAELRQQQIQPAPPVHMTWVQEVLLPKMPLQPSAVRLATLEKLINQQVWQAYDPNGPEIWARIKLELTNTCDK